MKIPLNNNFSKSIRKLKKHGESMPQFIARINREMDKIYFNKFPPVTEEGVIQITDEGIKVIPYKEFYK